MEFRTKNLSNLRTFAAARIFAVLQLCGILAMYGADAAPLLCAQILKLWVIKTNSAVTRSLQKMFNLQRKVKAMKHHSKMAQPSLKVVSAKLVCAISSARSKNFTSLKKSSPNCLKQFPSLHLKELTWKFKKSSPLRSNG